jgi:hypothetical protein
MLGAAVAGGSVLVAWFAGLSAVFMLVLGVHLVRSHHRRIRSYRGQLLTAFPALDSGESVRFAVLLYESVDDDACRVGSPREGRPDGRLTPFYGSILAHFTYVADSIPVPAERLTALRAVASLSARWAGPMIDYEFECEALSKEGDSILAFLSPGPRPEQKQDR